MKVAAIADLHCQATSGDEMRQVLEGVQDEAEVLLLAGDLTNLGLVDEMQSLLRVLAELPLPKVAVTGNHDHESGQADVLVGLMKRAGIHVLDGEAWELDGVGFVGTKGFGGGFGDHRLMPFGEAAIKRFVEAGSAQVVRLENALRSLECTRRVAILHYAPVIDTLLGEPPEIFPFLGSSPLADVLDHYGASVIVHGHAHDGSLTGATPGGIPVHNVSRYVLGRRTQAHYCVLEV